MSTAPFPNHGLRTAWLRTEVVSGRKRATGNQESTDGQHLTTRDVGSHRRADRRGSSQDPGRRPHGGRGRRQPTSRTGGSNEGARGADQRSGPTGTRRAAPARNGQTRGNGVLQNSDRATSGHHHAGGSPLRAAPCRCPGHRPGSVRALDPRNGGPPYDVHAGRSEAVSRRISPLFRGVLRQRRRRLQPERRSGTGPRPDRRPVQHE